MNNNLKNRRRTGSQLGYMLAILIFVAVGVSLSVGFIFLFVGWLASLILIGAGMDPSHAYTLMVTLSFLVGGGLFGYWFISLSDQK